MSSLESKSFSTPDETRSFADKGAAEMVVLDGNTVFKDRFEPGWRWSEHVRPLAGTTTCQSPHMFYVVSGRMHFLMDDGAEGDVGANEVARIEPGHDAWVVGSDPCIIVDFGATATFALPAQRTAGTKA
ncbi:cupin domain-containing protein [Actinopolymorpha rutila]|uniref:Mannose-6-phosphate isomerase-like protein (Cupin superfamily) n=1 Tax=Actinopolymorpha rutila TaxID=446787 RepID=A0A852ZIV7_9ACTN|nr:cupin domain-containing protein [Actinopolymorpha rutila]NYH88256.1 mannose-6-phosphate isomerase-like protein (cupin superfamily) [Actinopolymorpha rutila]